MNRPTLSVRYDGTVRIVFPQSMVAEHTADFIAFEMPMEMALSHTTNLQMTLARAGNHDFGPLCDAWTAGMGVCGLPDHHDGNHDFKRPLGPEHHAVLKRGTV